MFCWCCPFVEGCVRNRADKPMEHTAIMNLLRTTSSPEGTPSIHKSASKVRTQGATQKSPDRDNFSITAESSTHVNPQTNDRQREEYRYEGTKAGNAEFTMSTEI